MNVVVLQKTVRARRFLQGHTGHKRTRAKPGRGVFRSKVKLISGRLLRRVSFVTAIPCNLLHVNLCKETLIDTVA